MTQTTFASNVANAVDTILPEIVSLRHALHADPEIALQEHRTRAKLAAKLAPLPLTLAPPLLGTDLIATLDVGSPRTLCLRADMDALPIQEQTGLPYQSTTPGMMHACGHDGHMACLVGAATVLCQLKAQLDTNIRFIFQPGEEVACAGRDLVDKGACEGTVAAYALHGGPFLEVGHVSTKAGPLFAAGSFFDIEFQGKGCHGATPQSGHNPIPVAAAAVTRLEALHHRLNKSHGVVLSVCSFTSGTSSNIIPPSAAIRGTYRYLHADLGPLTESAIQEIIDDVTRGTGVTAKAKLDKDYNLPVVNDAAAVDRFERLARRYLPEDACETSKAPAMFSEDFAFYLRDRPGLMFWLGLGKDCPPLHNPAFDFNDKALRSGITMLCLLAGPD